MHSKFGLFQMSSLSLCAALSKVNFVVYYNCEDLADYYLINQIDTLEEPDRALRLCELIRKEASVCSLRE